LRRDWYFFLQLKKGGTSSCRLRSEWYFFLQVKKGVVLLPAV
jgi:hypothetical protein